MVTILIFGYLTSGKDYAIITAKNSNNGILCNERVGNVGAGAGAKQMR